MGIWLNLCRWACWLGLLVLVPAPVLAAPAASAAVPASAASAASASTPAASAAEASPTGLAGLRFEPPAIAFARPQELGGSSAARALVLHADPAASAALSYELRTTGEFTVTPARCELAVRGSCAVSVAFAPTKAGDTTAAVVVAEAKGGPTRVAATLSGRGVGVCEGASAFGCASRPGIWPVVAVALLYGLAMLAVRWHMVALPARRLLLAEIDAVGTRVDGLTGAPAGAAPIRALLVEAKGLLRPGKLPLLDSLFWTRGQEHAGWQLVHEAKEQLSLLLPAAELRVALEDAEVQLRQAGDEQAKALADRIQKALAATPPPAADREAALLREARNQLYDATDNEFASIACWHKKTSWLVALSLLLIVVLSAALGHAVFFLVGALGGLMSRLSRALGSSKLPTDYGLSWTTIFLSPMVGALAGWAGVLLVALAFQQGVLGKVFQGVTWGDTYGELALGLALVLGFSERVFVNIVGGVENKLFPAAAGAAAAAQLAIVTPAALPPGTLTSAYGPLQLEASGGKPGYEWSAPPGLPPGLDLRKDGRLSGQVTKAGNYTFKVAVKDTAGASAEKEMTLAVA